MIGCLETSFLSAHAKDAKNKVETAYSDTRWLMFKLLETKLFSVSNCHRMERLHAATC